MIVCQAAIAFCRWLCAGQISNKGLNEEQTYSRVREAMFGAWS
jgi:hypothetical protein